MVVLVVSMAPAAVHENKVCQQLQECCFLPLRSCVCRNTVRIEAANITDTNRVSVVALTMRARSANRPPFLDRAVKPDNIMITNASPASLFVPLADGLSIHVHTRRSGGTMQDDIVNKSHYGGTFSNVRKGTKDFPQTKRGVTLDLRHSMSNFNKSAARFVQTRTAGVPLHVRRSNVTLDERNFTKIYTLSEEQFLGLACVVLAAACIMWQLHAVLRQQGPRPEGRISGQTRPGHSRQVQRAAPPSSPASAAMIARSSSSHQVIVCLFSSLMSVSWLS